ncbi:hypothetical protein [Wolbachia endosymbiont (group E) of Neria commutata]|uniref:hypothetical protein n=1 Tax=Wolbachia endosymbiont (group E) of Neria commutata TaxID=3066149 RepID=UPI003132D605
MIDFFEIVELTQILSFQMSLSFHPSSSPTVIPVRDTGINFFHWILDPSHRMTGMEHWDDRATETKSQEIQQLTANNESA